VTDVRINGSDQGVRVLDRSRGRPIKGSESLTHFEDKDSDPLIKVQSDKDPLIDPLI
jgi:hypothetical protein